MSSGREQTRKGSCVIVIVVPIRQLEKIKKFDFGNRWVPIRGGREVPGGFAGERSSSRVVFSTFFPRLRLTYWLVASVAAPYFGSRELIPFLLEKLDQ
jgi:hypothetical protein